MSTVGGFTDGRLNSLDNLCNLTYQKVWVGNVDNLPVEVDGATSAAPLGATYIVQIPNDALTNDQALSDVGNGLLKNTVIASPLSASLSVATPGTDYLAPGYDATVLDLGVNNINQVTGNGYTAAFDDVTFRSMTQIFDPEHPFNNALFTIINSTEITGSTIQAAQLTVAGNITLGGLFTSGGASAFGGAASFEGSLSCLGVMNVAGDLILTGGLAATNVITEIATTSFTVSSGTTFLSVAPALINILMPATPGAIIIGAAEGDINISSILLNLEVTNTITQTAPYINLSAQGLGLIGSVETTLGGALLTIEAETININGITNVNGNINFRGGVTFTSLTNIEGDLSITGVLTVTGEANFSALNANGLATFAGGIVVTGGSTLGGTSALTGEVNITGATTLQSTLRVTGAANIVGLLSAEGEFNATGAATFEAEVNVTGLATFEAEVNVAGVATFQGDVALGGGLEIVGIVGIGGALAVGGGVGIAGVVVTAGDMDIGGDLGVLGGFQVAGGVNLTGNTTIDGGTINITGYARTGDLNGYQPINGNLSDISNITPASNSFIIGQTDDIFTTYVGQSLSQTQNILGIASTNSPTFVGLALTGGLTVALNTALTGTLNVTGATTLGALTASTLASSTTTSVGTSLTVGTTLNVTGGTTTASLSTGTLAASGQTNLANAIISGTVHITSSGGLVVDTTVESVFVEFIDSTTDPAAPSEGGILYSIAGALKYRGSNGTITTLAPA
jgi:hypothetical protein